MTEKRHEFFMARALELAKKSEGKTFPNPMVGAVIVKNGKVISEGHHKKAGAPHAEIIALRRAGKKARGADLYVTLEPCAHYGKTPPCVKSLIRSGIKRVFAAMKDPNPLVNGKGLSILRRNGIKVRAGICMREAVRVNKAYLRELKKESKKARDVYGNN